MRKTAKRADRRYTFEPHALVVGANLLGAAVIVAYGDSKDAFASLSARAVV